MVDLVSVTLKQRFNFSFQSINCFLFLQKNRDLWHFAAGAGERCAGRLVQHCVQVVHGLFELCVVKFVVVGQGEMVFLLESSSLFLIVWTDADDRLNKLPKRLSMTLVEFKVVCLLLRVIDSLLKQLLLLLDQSEQSFTRLLKFIQSLNWVVLCCVPS